MSHKKIIFRAYVDHLKNDDRVSGLFVTGSSKNGNVTSFSDFDLWVIFSDESGLSSFCSNIVSFADSVGAVRTIYQCTAHHYFIVFKPSVQIDLNLLTSAQFFSIRNAEKQILFDRKCFLRGQQKNESKSEKRTAAVRLLLQGYTTLERCASKLLKKDYFVTVKFLERVREDCLIPLFQISGIQKITTPISLKPERLNNKVRDLFIDTYANPTQNSCARGIEATSLLLLEIVSMLRVRGFEDYIERFNKFIIN